MSKKETAGLESDRVLMRYLVLRRLDGLDAGATIWDKLADLLAIDLEGSDILLFKLLEIMGIGEWRIPKEDRRVNIPMIDAAKIMAASRDLQDRLDAIEQFLAKPRG